jgi:hypothetical protein
LGDRIYYGDNTEAGTGRQTLSQDSTFGAYLWLSYDITVVLKQTITPRAVQASLSIGYAGIFGGEQRLDGSPTGVKTGEEQIRVNYTQYITPTWQGSITLTHDMSASGQFKQDFGLILRVAKVS